MKKIIILTIILIAYHTGYCQVCTDVSIFNKITLSQDLLYNESNNFNNMINFVTMNKHWPGLRALTMRAEQRINYDTRSIDILAWFNHHQPITSNGYKFYAIATAKLSNIMNNISICIIKNGYIYGNFTKEEEIDYLRKFHKYLDVDDVLSRINVQLFQSNISAARQSVALNANLNTNYKLAVDITIKLIQNKIVLNKLSISHNYYTSSLIFYFLKYKKHSTLHDVDIIKLFTDLRNILDKNLYLPSDLYDKVWTVQSFYIRELISKHKYKVASKVAGISLSDKMSHTNARNFLLGFIYLKFLGNKNIALKYFKEYNNTAYKIQDVTKSLYWIARCYEAMRNFSSAKKYYRIASKYSYNFYGQLANLAIGNNEMFLHDTLNNDDNIQYDNLEIMHAIKLLIHNHKYTLAHLYAVHVLKNSNIPEVVKILNLMHNIKGNIFYVTDVARIALEQGILIQKYAFPAPYHIVDNNSVENALIYAVIRQESNFHESVRDSLGAYGLMQIMPFTAREIAHNMNIKCDLARLTQDPYYNIKYGSYRLHELLLKTNSSYILSVASYNAGYSRVMQWVRLYGDPRSMKNVRDIVDWIELVPFVITREYIKKVLANLQVYRFILNKYNNKLQMYKDLVRS